MSNLKPGMKVQHETYGAGTIEGIHPYSKELSVRFSDGVARLISPTTPLLIPEPEYRCGVCGIEVDMASGCTVAWHDELVNYIPELKGGFPQDQLIQHIMRWISIALDKADYVSAKWGANVLAVQIDKYVQNLITCPNCGPSEPQDFGVVENPTCRWLVLGVQDGKIILSQDYTMDDEPRHTLEHMDCGTRFTFDNTTFDYE